MAQQNFNRTEFRKPNSRSTCMVFIGCVICLILFNHVAFCKLLHYDIRLDSNAIKRRCIVETSEKEAYVIEQTNRNDHPRIYEYFKSAGFKNVQAWPARARPWCAVYVHWVYKNCGVTLPKGNYAAVATWAKLRVRYPAKNGVPLPGDVVTYKPYSHAEIVKYYPLDPRVKVFYANGGNTSAGNKKEGVYINIPRPKSYIMYTIQVIPP